MTEGKNDPSTRLGYLGLPWAMIPISTPAPKQIEFLHLPQPAMNIVHGVMPHLISVGSKSSVFLCLRETALQKAILSGLRQI
jgi:hypothetical protein